MNTPVYYCKTVFGASQVKNASSDTSLDKTGDNFGGMNTPTPSGTHKNKLTGWWVKLFSNKN